MELVAIPGNSIPRGLRAGEVRTPDGVVLRYATADGGRAGKGTVCILPGRAECIEFYFETIGELRALGYAVAIIEWRGQGASHRPYANRMRGHDRNFDRMDIDLATFMTGVVLPDCPPPYFAVAHSLGGHVLMRALRRHTWFSRVLLCSPFLDIRLQGPVLRLTGVVAKLAVSCGLRWMFIPARGRRARLVSDFPGNPLTSDRRRFTRNARVLEAAPQLQLGGVSFGWLNAALKSIRELKRIPAQTRLRTPCMIIAPSHDKVVSTEASRAFAQRLTGVVFVAVENARHELLQERDVFREQFWAAFDSFIDQPEGSPASNTARAAQ